MESKKIFILYFLIIFTLIGVIPTFSANAAECFINAEIVFIIDTSGSMNNERITLCNVIDDVVTNLEAEGVILSYRIYALSENAGWPTLKPCEANRIVFAGICTNHSRREHWGPAVADLAPGPWAAPIKIIMPISDEGPYCGNGCDINDDNSITAAANAADANDVYVFPLQGDLAGGCSSSRMNNLVAQTTANDKKFVWGGTPGDMANDIYSAVFIAAWDGDGDGFMAMDCPCDPDNLPPGIIGCWDCEDTDTTIIQECLYGGLVPCGREVNDPNTLIDETAPCILCHIFVLFKRIVDEFIMPYVFLLVVLMIVIGGVILLTAGGNLGRIGQGKKILKTAMIGLVIVLAAWLIVNTIIIFITPAGSPFQTWHTINCPVP